MSLANDPLTPISLIPNNSAQKKKIVPVLSNAFKRFVATLLLDCKSTTVMLQLDQLLIFCRKCRIYYFLFYITYLLLQGDLQPIDWQCKQSAIINMKKKRKWQKKLQVQKPSLCRIWQCMLIYVNQILFTEIILALLWEMFKKLKV